MKLRKVTIDGFRGAPKPLELPLDGKSLCLLGENGRGKTTIVDGLEYWSIGKLTTECGGASVIDRAEGLRKDAGLAQPITSENELVGLDLATSPAVEVRVTRAELVEQVARSAEAIKAEAIADWNGVIKNREAAEAAALHDLVSAGQEVLATWSEDVCPLCLAPHERNELSTSLAERAALLAELDEKYRSARSALESHSRAIAELAGAVTTFLGSPPKDGWPHAEALKEMTAKLREHAEAANATLADGKECAAAPQVSFDEFLPELRAAAVSDQESPAVAALAQLERLRIAMQRSEEFRRKGEAKRQVADAVDGLRELTETQVKTAVEGAISKLGTVAADFYGRLVRDPVYSNIELNYTEGRRGGIEFSLTFDARHKVSPPQRVVSESQLNALGLAFFLAQLKVEHTPWRTLVLDDVVNSFDADHRMGLARLLAEEFSDWQVLLFTHDNMFATMSERFFNGWRFWQIVAWTPKEGPILSEGDPLKRLRARLDAGEMARHLGGLARFALERALSRPLERLGLPIRFDRRGLYSAPEYLDALQKGLAERGSALKDLPALTRMKGESYLVNVGAHDRQADPSLSTNDLQQMVADIAELDDGFTCTACGRPVWEMKKGHDRFQCKCSKLAV